jgi:glyoxylase-like metal-dependent hydrolase (beta-lactamase superfamily II)
MKDYLIVFDAPYGELQSRWVIDAAKARYPGKSIKYLVLTHHHMDHTGGWPRLSRKAQPFSCPAKHRVFREGAEKSAHTSFRRADEESEALKIYGIFENQTIKDETAEVRLLNFATGGEAADRPRARMPSMLIGQVVESKLIYVTDLISPAAGQSRVPPETIAVGATLREFDVEDDVTIVGGHRTTVKRAEITAALAARTRQA